MNEEAEMAQERMRGRNKWTPEHFREVLKRAGKVIECSWGVMGVRDKKSGEMATVLAFSDDDTKAFAHAFAFKTSAEVYVLCADLIKMADQIAGVQEVTDGRKISDS